MSHLHTPGAPRPSFVIDAYQTSRRDLFVRRARTLDWVPNAAALGRGTDG
jgi:hypothetical protein